MAKRRPGVIGLRHAGNCFAGRRCSGNTFSREPGRRAGRANSRSVGIRHHHARRSAALSCRRPRIRGSLRLGRRRCRAGCVVSERGRSKPMIAIEQPDVAGGDTSTLLPIPFAGECDLNTADIAVGGAPSRARAPLRVACDGSAGSMVFGRLRQRCNGTGTSNELSAADLLTAWRSQGDDVLQSLTGEFLVAMWDSARGRALLAVDRFSTYPLFWCARNGRLGFSARPAVAAKHAGVALDVDWQSVLAYAYFHVIPAPLCIYRAVHRLDLGEALRVDGGRAETYRYWTPIFDERRTFDFTTERDAFLGELRSGVAECTAGLERNDVGCFLSGGT